MVEYDVLGNERHKAVCKLGKMPDKYPNVDHVCMADLGAWKRDLANAIGADTELFSAIRDRLIHLLGGDQPTLSELFGILKEDDDAVDARPSDAASADSPVHGAVGCGYGGSCGCDDLEEVAPITQELRDYLSEVDENLHEDWLFVNVEWSEVNRLCDAIDAIHANLERDYATACRVNERQDLEYADLAKRYDNTISLPFDKDGKVWDVGDELLDDGMVCEVVGIGPNRIYYYCDATDTVEWTQADSRRHYERKLAVEDVLRQVIACANNGTHVHGALDTEQIVAEYAAKLKLSDADA